MIAAGTMRFSDRKKAILKISGAKRLHGRLDALALVLTAMSRSPQLSKFNRTFRVYPKIRDEKIRDTKKTHVLKRMALIR